MDMAADETTAGTDHDQAVDHLQKPVARAIPDTVCWSAGAFQTRSSCMHSHSPSSCSFSFSWTRNCYSCDESSHTDRGTGQPDSSFPEKLVGDGMDGDGRRGGDEEGESDRDRRPPPAVDCTSFAPELDVSGAQRQAG